MKTVVRKVLRSFSADQLCHALYHCCRSLRYRKVKSIALTFDGREVVYSTEDFYSNYWFLPRCRRNRWHEPQVTRLLLNELDSSTCFADLGASIGYFSVMAADRVRPNSVYAFEIDETLVPIIRRNAELNGLSNINLTIAAIGAEDGKCVTHTPIAYCALNRLYTHQGQSLPIELRTESLRLDTFFAGRSTTPGLIKMDVEGCELDALIGMSELVRRSHPRMVIEVHPRQLKERGLDWHEIIGWLREHDYEVMAVSRFSKLTADLLSPFDDAAPQSRPFIVFARP